MTGRNATGERTVVWDLLLVAGLVVLTNVSVFIAVVSETPLRLVLGLPFVVFLPGYAIIAALFPRKNDHIIWSIISTDTSTVIDLAERIGLSVALSVATVGLTGMGLSAIGVGVGLQPVILTVSALSLVALAIAWFRRSRLSAEERFVPSTPRLWISESAVSERVDVLLNVAVVVAVLVAGAGVAFGTNGFGSEREYTELSVLSAPATGQPTADSYPTNLTLGEPNSLLVVIENHEEATTTYTAVVELQRLGPDGRTVRARDTITQFQTTLDQDQRTRRPVQVEPSFTGANLRLVVSLYRGDSAPTLPDDAFREVHLNVTVVNG